MSCLDAKISLVPKHQFIVPSTLLAPATEIRTHKAMKIHTLRQLTYELFFQNSSKIISFIIRAFWNENVLSAFFQMAAGGLLHIAKRNKFQSLGAATAKE